MSNLSRGATFLLFISLFPLSLAANKHTVMINEVAWMGTENSSYDEWIELYNDSPDTISIEGWTLKNADGSLSINLKGSIPPHDLYLLEKTDDNSVPSIKADLIYKGTLKNSGEKLELFAGSNNLIDSINCGEGWFAGNNETKQTMEKNSLGEWVNSKEKGGSPKEKSSEPQPTAFPLFKNDGGDSLSGAIKENSAYPSGVILNEILPSPEGEDAKEEWIVATIQQTRTNSAYL